MKDFLTEVADIFVGVERSVLTKEEAYEKIGELSVIYNHRFDTFLICEAFEGWSVSSNGEVKEAYNAELQVYMTIWRNRILKTNIRREEESLNKPLYRMSDFIDFCDMKRIKLKLK